MARIGARPGRIDADRLETPAATSTLDDGVTEPRTLPVGCAAMDDHHLAHRPLSEPATGRLAPDAPGRSEILAAHAAALAAGDPAYEDPATGLFVLTASYLAERGTCCETGCRHCPYTE